MRKSIVMISALALAMSAAMAGAAAADGIYTPGTYTAQASGMGNLEVSVTVSEDAIEEVVIDGSEETPEIGGAALEELTAQVMESQSAEIEGVSLFRLPQIGHGAGQAGVSLRRIPVAAQGAKQPRGLTG